MITRLSAFCLLVFCIISCKQKKEESKNFISIVSLIKKQVAHVDTSLYPIMKINIKDSLNSDTVYVPRGEFADLAKDFLSIPDLSDQKVARRFKEEPAIYEKLINRVIITYTPIDFEKEEIKKQEMLVTPSPAGDKVNNIIVIKEISNRDSFLQKKMLWQLDKYFQIITTSQKKGKPEESTIIKVSWNEDKNR